MATEDKKKSLKDAFDQWFIKGLESKAYRNFCKEVYGLGIFLYSVIDKEQVEILEKEAEFRSTDRVIDIGCGTGGLIEYLADKYGFYGLGIDFAKQTIQKANEKTKQKNNVSYKELDMNNLGSLEGRFDKVIVADSLYFVSDTKKVVGNIYNLLKERGKAFIFYSHLNKINFLFDDLLKEMNIEYFKINFSKNEKLIWKKTIEIAEKYKEEFIKENNIEIYQDRIDEASEFVDKEANRYLYIFEKK